LTTPKCHNASIVLFILEIQNICGCVNFIPVNGAIYVFCVSISFELRIANCTSVSWLHMYLIVKNQKK